MTECIRRPTSSNTKRLQIAPALTAAICMLSACGARTDWIRDRVTPESPAAPSAATATAGHEEYLKELGQIASGDPAAQAEVFADAEAAAQLTPGPSSHLRLGLVLAVPGHPESNPERAVNLLRGVLTQTQLLTDAEISLARILLNSAERQIVADAEARRLRNANTRAQQTRTQAATRRLAVVEAENRRLREELQAAEAKLDAITSIEQSIRDRE